MPVQVTSAHLAQMIRQAEIAHPHECCGILLGEGDRVTGIQPAANVHPQPLILFEIDPQTLVDAHRAAREGGPQVLGYYHSHPVGPAEPSATDQESAAGDGRIWAIIAGNAVQFWQDFPSGFEPLSYGDPRG